MRNLVRPPEPSILTDKKDDWKIEFLISGKKRPESSKYAHKKIKAQLENMSYNKCFYCETKLTDRSVVDHHIEVSINKELAFEWKNLYLCCDNCNNKTPHSTIAIYEALDPCVNTDNEIENHITFQDELIIPNNNSEIGLKTIQKYRLSNNVLDHKRTKKLKIFIRFIVKFLKNKKKKNVMK